MVIIQSLNMINLLELDAQYQPIITKSHDQIQHENNLKVTKTRYVRPPCLLREYSTDIKNYYLYFEAYKSNMNKTWEGIK